MLTDDGRIIEARVVLSTASPVNTLINLVGEEYFDESVIDRLRNIPPGGTSRLVIVSNGPIKLKGELNNYRDSILQLPFGETVVHGNYLIVTGLPTKDELSDYVSIDWSSIKAFELITPSDYESTFRLAGGNLNHLPMTEDYMFSNRPVPGWGGYSTPIRGSLPGWCGYVAWWTGDWGAWL
ncbi:hypothetical protein [Vulcanisaeta distributa]|uniref:hypothetical protein n=1 Tax=Vulcanisaeta distributa TaxID=164451 RepID=UPI000AE85317|nr:hypothetical protein [Vulcanisaeta distributa]